ncbi:MAG: hypothetical protein AB7O97_09410 [Planctomycetota bacterium]
MTTLLLLLSTALLPQDPPVQDPSGTPAPLPMAESAAPPAGPAADPAADPAQVDARTEAPGGRLDQVELLDGEVLEGRIVLERGNYLEIELEPGATVGFRRSAVAAIRRGGGAPVPTVAAAVVARDEWFTLHDGSGAAVGWLHGTLTPQADGSVRVLEEWEFAEGQRWYQLTALETTDAALRPLSSYFRERVREEVVAGAAIDPMARRTRVRAERIVEAQVDGSVLTVRRLSPDGRSERQLPWPQGATFPLLARLDAAEAGCDVTVFDAAQEELQTRTFAAMRQRRVLVDGVEKHVREIVEDGGNVRNATWRDASAHVLRREIAGPALVAVPSTAELAQRALDAVGPVPAAFVAEPEGRFGLWRPNPAWETQPAAAGAVSLRCGLHDATITLALLDHLDAGASLDAAAGAVARWVTLLHPDLRVEERSWPEIRGRRAARLECLGGTGLDARRARVWVLPVEPGFLVLQCTAPEQAFGELEADFAAVVQRVETVPAAVELLQPAADPDGGAGSPPAEPGPVEPTVPIRVRVPRSPTEGG